MFFAVVILGEQSLGNSLESEPSLMRECREINTEMSESDDKNPAFFLAEPEQILMGMRNLDLRTTCTIKLLIYTHRKGALCGVPDHNREPQCVEW